MNKFKNNQLFKSSLMALEQRYLLDGAIAETLENAQPEPTDVEAVSAEADDAHSQSGNELPFAELESTWEAPEQTSEIIFIDTAVSNVPELMSSISSNAEVVLLQNDRDGVEQIADILRERENIDAIHILSHGTQGRLFLGNENLDIESMRGKHADNLAIIGDSLSETGDILIYGCDFTGGEAGRDAAELLGLLTRADVGGSSDDTGSAELGGNWVLETRYGEIEAETVTAEAWNGLLAVEAANTIVTIQDSDNPSAGVITLSNNGETLSVTTAATPDRVSQMLKQIWTYQETGDVGNASLVFDITGIPGITGTQATQFGLIIADTADLTQPTTRVLTASGFNAANNTVFFHEVNLAPGEIFALATLVEPDNLSIDPIITGKEDTTIDLGLKATLINSTLRI